MTNSNIKFGRIHKPDERDRMFLVPRKRSVSGSKYWREGTWQGNQGDTPQCVGYAWSHWLSGYPIRQYLNPEGIYKISQFLDEWKGEAYDGSSVRGGAKALELLGFIKEYRWAFDIESLVNCVLSTGPVVVGTNWYESMMNVEPSGRIRVGGDVMGGHAYFISGVSTVTKLFRIKNSWGDWGKDGHAFISIDDMERLLKEDGEACLAVEQPIDSFVK